MSSQNKRCTAAGDLAGGEYPASAWRAIEVKPSANVVPPAADPVSVAMAARFSAYTQIYPMMSARLADVQEILAMTLGANAGGSPTTTEPPDNTSG